MKNFLFAALMLLTSCVVPQNLIYYSDAHGFSGQEVTQSYENKIQKDDVLTITVSSQSPELTVPFNQSNSRSLSDVKYESDNGFLVDIQGNIVFPIIGKIHVLGMTHRELASCIEKTIVDGGYIKDPIVFIKLQNFKISVLGEVKIPGVKNISSERITILDALGLAGDLTIYGHRENVSIIREENGKRELAYIDIGNKDIFNSPYYYLHPNDIIYVQPNKKQQRTSTSNPIVWPTVMSSASLLATLLNLILP